MTGTAATAAQQDQDIPETVVRLRAAFDSGLTRPAAWRRRQLHALRRLLRERTSDIEEALYDDLRKGRTESHLTEIGGVLAEIEHALRHLDRWMRPRRVAVPMNLKPATARIHPEPLGVCLVIAPWNYPLTLTLNPLVGALAAGNAAVVKPSELAPATSALLADLLPRYLEAVAVVEGAVEETTTLLAQRFDHIFYTGNGTVGRIVAAAAAKNLTPVTLELGGKSPVFIDETADMAVTARRLAWGKFTNAGQTCVAPDYVLVTHAARDSLLAALPKAIQQMFGPNPRTSADYGRIVNDRHFQRLTGLTAEGDLLTGGVSDAAERYIAPTVLTDVPAGAPVMTQEIFGPILPVLTVGGVGEAIDFINARDKPLSLYAFTRDKAARQALLEKTSSGGLVYNAPMIHLGVPNLPFGGVGESGMGAYHGKTSFDTFSHRKSVLSKPTRPDTLRLIYAPHTSRSFAFIAKAVSRTHPLLGRKR
ncbi:aldehyde dehydrogenase family protein [Streptomyces sp. TLI_105]|uniref:aldehyde dehydrogenase family protein n=1 Tax=Streptomyces sp. TLI_105 TaxID=1881019 RepID=UPI00089A4716|nr:aldehyde dehydrogenase family protein [Streptomyces sp. TLI_105]SEB62522.1 aldehyde dehydrogenase (NAD+) [Streptomyces sp. TLI_105]